MTWYRKGEIVGKGGTDVDLAFFMLDAVNRRGGEGADDWYRAFEQYVNDMYDAHTMLLMCSDDSEDYETMFIDWVLDSVRQSRETFGIRFGFEWRDE